LKKATTCSAIYTAFFLLAIRQIVSGQSFTKNLFKKFINRPTLNIGDIPGIGFLCSRRKKTINNSLSSYLPVRPDNVAISSIYWGNIHDLSATKSSGFVFLTVISNRQLFAERYFFISALKERENIVY
jgi:hypothetical protein